MQLPERTLNNGLRIPGIGFGTYKSTGEITGVLDMAIEAGYRYFDTASFYENEGELGRALAGSQLPREAFQVASKVWKTQMGCAGTRAAFEQSLALLQTDYLDLYLIHWPKQSPEDTFWEQRMLDTWKTMEELYEAGKIRAIGVSNFLPHHLEALLEKASVRPAVNQLEFHPGYLQGEALEFCKKEQITVQAWSPIGRGRVLRDPLLQGMAAGYGVSVAQLCLRFDIQMGVMPLPKASSIERMRENLDLTSFVIRQEDMEQIRRMPITGWSGEHPDRERVSLSQ